MATIFETITELSGIVTDAITAGVDTNIPARNIRNTLIKVSTGKYYEVLPIIVPAECCVIGDELRSTRVEPRTVTNSTLTPAGDFKFSYEAMNRIETVIGDIVEGVAVTPTTGNTQTQDQTWPYAQRDEVGISTKKLARTIRRRADIALGNKEEAIFTKDYNMSDINYGYARDTLFLNKKFLQEEVIAYIADNYPNLKYSRTKCRQDVGFILDAVRYDLTYGGNWQSVKAGEAYYEGTNLQVNSSEKAATLAAYGYLKSIMQSVSRNITVTPVLNSTVTQISSTNGGNATAANTINSLMQNIIDIVDSGSGTVSITYPDVSGASAALQTASDQLLIDAPTVKQQTTDFINAHFGSFVYDSAKCRRDLRNIIIDTSFDVALGTNYNAVFNGLAYQRPNNAYNLQNQRIETVGAIRNARDALKISVTDDGSSAGGSSNASTRITTAFDEIVDIINNDTPDAYSFPNPTGADQNRIDAKTNIQANIDFIKADTIAYLTNTYGAGAYGLDGLVNAEIEALLHALTYDILYTGTRATTRIAESYIVNGSLVGPSGITAGLKTETLAWFAHVRSIIDDIVEENGAYTPQSGNTEIQSTPGSAATATESAELQAKIDIITAVITAENTDSMPVAVDPDITWADAEYQIAFGDMNSDREGIIADTVQFINTTYNDFNYNIAKCQRDLGYIIDAARYDFMLGTNFASIAAAYSYLREPSAKIVGSQKAATIAANEYARTLLVANQVDATAIAGINTTWEWIEDIIWSGSAEGGTSQTAEVHVYDAVRQLELNKEFIVEEALNHVDTTFRSLVTSVVNVQNEFKVDSTSWMYEGLAVKFVDLDDSAQSVEEAGLTEGTTYYIKEIKDANTVTLSETQYGSLWPIPQEHGENFYIQKAYDYNRALCARDVRSYVDAIKWDLVWPQEQQRNYNNFGYDLTIWLPASYKTRLAARYYVNSIIGSQEEDMYYLRNGTGLRLQTLAGLSGDLGPANSVGYSLPTAGAYASLDPGWGPDDSRAWITARSPYVQNVSTFGYAATGQRIDGALHNGGNDSIVSNDFTQVISDGIGAHILNNGRAELVSVFTYYSHVGYLAETGGRIRATNGNNSYGTFGSIANGVDPDETPVTAIVDNRLQYNATIANVFTDNVNEIYQLEYSHAGNEYTEAAINIFGAGDSEEVIADEFRDEGTYQVRILEVDDSTGNPDATAGGSGYVNVTNTAQTGTSSSITLAATDGNLSTAYPGMKLYITAGNGVGQFGLVDTYNSGTKIATVIKETDGTAGWDHVIPGTTIVSPDSTSTYLIEPAISFTAPTKSNSQETIASDVWPAVHFMETSAQYTNVSVTSQSDGTGATFDVVRNGRKYYLTINSAGSGYTRLDTLTIPGTSLGGTSTTNDITITITVVNSVTGAVVDFDFAGYGREGVFIALPDSGTTGQQSFDGASWATNTLASSVNWLNLTSGLADDGSTTFKQSYAVAVGNNASSVAINYSATGLSGSWSAPGSTPSLAITSTADVAFGNVGLNDNRFVVIADNTRDVAYSTDGGASWTTTSNALPSTGYTAITFGQKKFVAVKSGSREMAYSADGVTWTTVTLGMPATHAWNDIEWGNGRFVAVATDTTDIAYSLNGSAWTAVSSAIVGTAPAKIAYGQGMFVVTTDDTNQISYSEDGVYWPSGGYTLSNTYTGGLNAVTFGAVDKSPLFVAIQDATTTAVLNATIGATTRGRAAVASEKVFEIRITEPGSGYGVTAPTMTITDPNNTVEALFQVYIGTGQLAQPTFVARGSGFISATAEIDDDNSNGHANFLQSGSFIAVRRLSDIPVNGSNVVFDSLPDNVFKLVNVVSRIGTNDGSYTAFLQISPTMEIFDVPPDEDPVTMRIRFSQVRLTGHDFLDIGTGNFDDTNYPNEIYGDPVNPPTQANETVDGNGGRVFFTATDQDGNFRVGDLFSIEQATGVATLNAEAFNIAGLQELTLGEVTLGGNSASVTEFSTDPFFTANSDSVVPTQRAIKAYIEAQIGGGGASLVVNSVTAGDIFIGGTEITTVTGAQINIKANVNFTKSVLGLPLAYNYFLR